MRDVSLLCNDLIAVGDNSQPSDFYTAPSNISVGSDTDYRICIDGLTLSSFNLKQQRIKPSALNFNSSIDNKSASAQINGTFSEPENNYELWKIWVEQNSITSNTIYFYLTKNKFSKNPAQSNENYGINQYEIKFDPDTVDSKKNTNVSSNPGLMAYWNKLYCLDKIATGTLNVNPSPTNKVTFSSNQISPLNFINYSSLINFPITIMPHILKTDYFTKFISAGKDISNIAQLTVNPYDGNGGSTQCSDGIDNDEDCGIDMNDIDCENVEDISEFGIGKCPPSITTEFQCVFGFCFECSNGDKFPSNNCSVIVPGTDKYKQNCGSCQIKIIHE